MKKIISMLLAVILLFQTISVSAESIDFFPRFEGNSSSLVDAINSVAGPSFSSFEARKQIAAANGYADGTYSGEAAQNLDLLQKMRNGVLVNPFTSVGQKESVGVEYYPRCSEHHTSITEALSSIGEDGSYRNRVKIAALNGLKSYNGLSSENIHLLSLLKQAKLIKSISSTQNVDSFIENTITTNPYVCYNYQQCTENDHSIYEVSKDKAPLRENANNEGKIITRLEVGQLLSVAEVIRNSKNNQWLRIEYQDDQGRISNAYMYSGNCKSHSHVFSNVLNNENGTLKICTMCAYSVVSSEGKSFEKQLISVLDQSVKGDYSQEDADFWGLVGRVLVGEIPVVSVAAEVRDLLYDITHDVHIGLVALDVIALIPVVGILKHADNLYALKYSDDIANAGKLAIKVGKYNMSDDVLQLFMFGKGINGKNVSGAHNMQNFLRTISSKGGDLNKCIESTVAHPSVEGIYNITYRTGNSKALAKSPKTVYDPSVISDSQMFIWATEALSNAKNTTSNYIVGWASNGLKFEAQVDAAGNILHFYPKFD